LKKQAFPGLFKVMMFAFPKAFYPFNREVQESEIESGYCFQISGGISHTTSWASCGIDNDDRDTGIVSGAGGASASNERGSCGERRAEHSDSAGDEFGDQA
jgi:hypothetical protein